MKDKKELGKMLNDLLFDEDLIKKLKDEDIDELADRITDRINEENLNRTDAFDIMIEEMYNDMKKQEKEKKIKYKVIYDFYDGDYEITIIESNDRIEDFIMNYNNLLEQSKRIAIRKNDDSVIIVNVKDIKNITIKRAE